jgi:hypothetical protein
MYELTCITRHHQMLETMYYFIRVIKVKLELKELGKKEKGQGFFREE